MSGFLGVFGRNDFDASRPRSDGLRSRPNSHRPHSHHRCGMTAAYVEGMFADRVFHDLFPPYQHQGQAHAAITPFALQSQSRKSVGLLLPVPQGPRTTRAVRLRHWLLGCQRLIVCVPELALTAAFPRLSCRWGRRTLHAKRALIQGHVSAKTFVPVIASIT